jgi:hypothetical protein
LTADRPIPEPAFSDNGPVTNHLLAESSDGTYQLTLDGFPDSRVVAESLARDLRDLDLSQITPREAIDWLFAQQGRL